jgi:hypothetical protein
MRTMAHPRKSHGPVSTSKTASSADNNKSTGVDLIDPSALGFTKIAYAVDETLELLSIGRTALYAAVRHLVQEIPDDMVRRWADHHSKLPGLPLIQSKRQWKDLKNEIKRLQDAGIDPSKINGPGVYYPERPNGK